MQLCVHNLNVITFQLNVVKRSESCFNVNLKYIFTTMNLKCTRIHTKLNSTEISTFRFVCIYQIRFKILTWHFKVYNLSFHSFTGNQTHGHDILCVLS